MDAARWNRVREVLADALERTPAERAAYLRTACDDTAMRREVEELLAVEDDAFLEVTPAQPGPHAAPVRIGPYRVLREIGRGGMGSVYLAMRADDLYRKRVAIKVARGAASDSMLQRFRHERQILAALDHPHIARLIDGGVTADGLPYFVMEHVEGENIDVYCRSRKPPAADILRLFAKVCEAVQYAHQNLVVHRDLKPGNVLVTSGGEVKLVDFGIAKILRPELFGETIDPTQTGSRPMTIAYASPEQIRNETVTTASDIYSLGVILYELLTQTRPYDLAGKTSAEVEKLICEDEPAKPSAVAAGKDTRSRLAGDLDNIVLMALRKEPRRRYASCERFAGDIRLFLDGMPVAARDNTLFYRAGKFLRRNSLSSAFAAAMAVGLAVSVWTIDVQRKRAERRFQEVRELANAYLFEVHDAIATLQGSTQARHLIVRRAQTYLDRLASESRNDSGLLTELAGAYEKVGMIQFRPGFPHLGDSAGAAISHRKALELRERAAAENPRDILVGRNLATAHLNLANALRVSGDSGGSLTHSKKGLELLERLLERHPDNERLRTDLITGYNRLGTITSTGGDVQASLELYRKSLAIAQSLHEAHPKDAAHRRNLVLAYHKVGDALGNPNVLNLGDPAGALEHFERALALAEALATEDATNGNTQRMHMVALTRSSQLQAVLGRPAEAKRNAEKAAALAESIAAKDRQNMQGRRDLANALIRLATVNGKAGAYTEALAAGERSLRIREELAARDPKNAQFREELADTLYRFGEARLLAGQSGPAAALLERAAGVRAELSRRDPRNAFQRRTLADAYLLLADARRKTGGSAPAEAKALELLRGLQNDQPRPGDRELIEKLSR